MITQAVAAPYLEQQAIVSSMAGILQRWCVFVGDPVARYSSLRDFYTTDQINLYGDQAARLAILREKMETSK